ncbi:MAG: uracil-DNA glycosylase family protein [Bacteroidota bacterium]|nr:uracil-DNA glycosylase family protein [Bacteroidota bacterium]
MHSLLKKIHRCETCISHLQSGCRPVVQLSVASRIIIIGQAPGKKVHESGIPWRDKSGATLRRWMNVDEETFYNPEFFSIMPMSFCYPGKGISGDLPPRRECAPLWHTKILKNIKNAPLILLIGNYAQQYYLKKEGKNSLTENVKNFREFSPQYFPLPHPSPRNQNWIKINPWFMEEAIPELRKSIREKITN